jgi:hypothetical protein
VVCTGFFYSITQLYGTSRKYPFIIIYASHAASTNLLLYQFQGKFSDFGGISILVGVGERGYGMLPNICLVLWKIPVILIIPYYEFGGNSIKAHSQRRGDNHM